MMTVEQMWKKIEAQRIAMGAMQSSAGRCIRQKDAEIKELKEAVADLEARLEDRCALITELEHDAREMCRELQARGPVQ